MSLPQKPFNGYDNNNFDKTGEEIEFKDTPSRNFDVKNKKLNCSSKSISIANDNGDEQNDQDSAYEAILTKEQLKMKSQLPFWKMLRRILKLGLIFTLIGMITFLVTLIIISPRCEEKPKLFWWQNSIIYKIDMDQIKKLNSDSKYSPLENLSNCVEHFLTLKADAIWFTHMNNLSHGFDKIDSKYGTNEIFKALIEKYHSKNIKIIIDLIPNYTNDDHLWFKMSQYNKTYFDYYVWTKNINNWINSKNDSAWSKLNEYYFLHQFDKTQPDLNYYNEDVYQYLLNSIGFWIDLGVDGFNLLTISRIYEDFYLANETILPNNNRLYKTRHRRETFHLIADIKSFISRKLFNSNKEILLMLDSSELEDIDSNILLKYYGNNQLNGLDLIPYDLTTNFAYQKESLSNNVIYNLDIVKSIKKTPSWQVNKNSNLDENERFLLWVLGSYLEGTNIIELPSNNLERILMNGDEPNPKISNALKIRSELKSVIFGHLKILKNITNDLILFKRYIRPEKNVLVILNLDKNSKIISNQVNHDIKDLDIKNKILDIDYSYSAQADINSIRKFEFDKNGFLIKEKIPQLSVHISTFAYTPELKDLF